ncbi:Na+/H+ antiporter NhaC family protein [Phocoenobacter skyensis]|uniref:Na+/H+ antiporter NhaC n=2 Tax=Phocoenobacter skyensis TaxID=97481 RepID=A0A1H7Z7T8_9PAST|nr:sodium:proton antiporter [Pasteurella skyensis]SEM54672.1 Na+/H+ antiporter NhaC [Pasteurella skyensis]
MPNGSNTNKGNIKGLFPLFAFLIVYILVRLLSGSFETMPIMVGISIGCLVAFFLNNKEHKISFTEKVTIFCKGGGEETLILMVIIFLLAGAFYSVANSMHAVDAIVNIGLSILPSNMILPGLFVVSCILSFAMGTSMGTVSTLAPIAIGIASKIGVDIPLVAGIVIGGAMFGDNLSFISDTTIAATRTQEVSMKDKFKVNFLMVLPAIIINIGLLLLVDVNASASTEHLDFNVINILPYMTVIILSLIGMHVIPVMGLGILSGLIIGVFHNDFTILETFKVVHTGMVWMQDMALIAVLVGGMVALMKYLGGIDFLLYHLTKNVKSVRAGEFSIATLVSLLDIATTNNTISIIVSGPISKNIGNEIGIDRSRIASILDLFSSAFSGLSPFGGQLLVMAGLCSISPIDIIPYVWYCMLMLVFGIFFIMIGWPKMRREK